MNKRQADAILDNLLNQPDAAKRLADAIISDFERAEARRLEHVARIDALEKPTTMRWCVSAAGNQGRGWLKTVAWDESKPGWVVKSTTWTPHRKKAGCFLPECALAVAKQMSQLVDIKFEKP